MSDFKKIFQPESGISSKRVIGAFGFIVTAFVLIWCMLHKQEAPEITTIFIITSGSLLGVETISKAFKKDG